MKTQLTRMFALFGLLLAAVVAAAPASAQGGRTIVVNIPFEFVVGNERMPAGDYTVRRIVRDSEKTLLIRSTDGSAAATIHTNAVETKTPAAQAKLTFVQYGEQYFLAQVWTPGSTSGREVTKSRIQRSLERELEARVRGGDELAATQAEKNIVTITASVR